MYSYILVMSVRRRDAQESPVSPFWSPSHFFFKRSNLLKCNLHSTKFSHLALQFGKFGQV